MTVLEEARRIKNKLESFILKKKGGVGCATGYKIVNSKKSDELLNVKRSEKKKTKSELKEEDRVPKSLEGVLTDVVESGTVRAL